MSTVAEAITVKRARLESVDVVRGVIMIIMALDHTRDFFGQPGSPTNLATASAALFFTRWITNICAPVFFLLTGTGAWLSLRKRTKPELSRFLFTRGLWLIFLDLVLFRCLVVQFNFDYHMTVITVLWALGWAMIVLSALVHLPPSVVTAFGVVMIATHNLLDSVRSANPLWSILHSPNIIFERPGHTVFLAYPLIPWVGVTAVGYGLGQIYAWDPPRRRTFLLRLGIVLTIGFRHTARHQHLRRPIPLDGSAHPHIHRSLLPKHHQVPPVTALSSHDARPRTALPPSSRYGHAAPPAPRPDHRQSADVLLPVALRTHPHSSRSSSATRATDTSTGCSSHPTSPTIPSPSLRDGGWHYRSSTSSGPASCSRCTHSAAGTPA